MQFDVVKSLLACSLFKGLSREDVRLWLDSTAYRLKEYEKRDIYILAGMPYKDVDIVLRGELVARMVSISGKSVEVSRLKEGDIIAPAFIFASDNTVPVSVETERETMVLRMSKVEFERTIDSNSIIRRNFIRVLSDIDVFLTKKMRILSLFTVREKVAYYLKETARKQGTNEVILDKSRQVIADSFGIQKFSLLRVMSEFAKSGAIRIEGKKISILDWTKL